MADPLRLREELGRMRELIAADPRVKARFDLDGNGVIDGEEWEQVRRLVVSRLEREEAARREAEAHDDELPVVVGAVAQRIWDEDLPASASTPPGAPSLAACHDLVIEERGLASLVPGLFRRNYALLSLGGQPLGEIRQREQEWAQALTNKNPLYAPDLHFDVVDHATGEAYTFRRSQALLDQHVVILDGSGGQVGHVEQTFGVIKPTYRVVSTFARSYVTVKWHLWHPFSLTILDVVDDKVGEIERGFAGLGGFLVGQNRLRVRMDPDKLEPSFRFGVIAAAVLAEMGRETRDQRSSLLGALTD